MIGNVPKMQFIQLTSPIQKYNAYWKISIFGKGTGIWHLSRIQKIIFEAISYLMSKRNISFVNFEKKKTEVCVR